jgi:hypothetical protein
MLVMIQTTLIAFCCLLFSAVQAPTEEEAMRAWQALRGDGYVALVRHAVGDPSNFRLDDCATQRNLSEAGRGEARALGDRFGAQKV